MMMASTPWLTRLRICSIWPASSTSSFSMMSSSTSPCSSYSANTSSMLAIIWVRHSLPVKPLLTPMVNGRRPRRRRRSVSSASVSSASVSAASVSASVVGVVGDVVVPTAGGEDQGEDRDRAAIALLFGRG
jgi:hypothetical protein